MSGKDTFEGSAWNETETSALQVLNEDKLTSKNSDSSNTIQEEKVPNDDANDPDATDSSCVICLETMTRADKQYPMLCPKECGFNMCQRCICGMIASYDSGINVCSDGNTFRVRLHCPNCRSDLSDTIQDTLELRRASNSSSNANSDSLDDVPDSELGAKDLRRKHALGDDGVLFHRAEMRYGIHHQNNQQDNASHDSIDEGLFSGLAFAMTDEEQQYVNKLMTSGCKDKLAQASLILANISQMSLQGITPSMRSNNPPPPPTNPKPTPRTTSPQPSYTTTGIGKQSSCSYQGRLLLNEQDKIKLDTQNKWKTMHPMPVRMPHAYTFQVDFDPYAKRWCMITFVDDEEELPKHNLVRDAFSILKVDRRNRVIKQPIRPNVLKGVENILSVQNKDGYTSPSASSSRTTDSQSTKPWRRVVVSSVRGQPARLGLRAGDVITHLDGEPFTGNSEMLRFYLLQKRNKPDAQDIGEDTNRVQIVVNAEPGTAEALHLRSLC